MAFDSLGGWLASPAIRQEPPPRSADLIVALGGGSGEREATAADLFSRKVARYVLLTGFADGTAEARTESLRWPFRVLTTEGVPPESILTDSVSASTWDEAVNTLALLKARGWRRVVVVTDPPHLRRVAWVWTRAARNTDVEVTFVSSSPTWWRAERWWRDERSAVFVFNEVLKLCFYVLKHGAHREAR